MSHIITVHAQFGSNHLQKELEDMTKGDNGKAGNVTKNITEVPVHVANNDVVHKHFHADILCVYFSFPIRYLPIIYLSLQSPPPRFS
ncbi:MAG: hypothetical protein H7258_14270 [Ferruginibacter sp.]|nr:hypothetical protein [Ferruginibacter sp.]